MNEETQKSKIHTYKKLFKNNNKTNIQNQKKVENTNLKINNGTINISQILKLAEKYTLNSILNI